MYTSTLPSIGDRVVIRMLDPLVVEPGEDRAQSQIELLGHRVLGKVLGQDTGGQFTVGLLQAPPLSGPPLHCHTEEDEWFYILKGEFCFEVGNRCFQAGPGTSIFAPRFVPHTWQNFGTEIAEALVLITPPRLEEFFLQAGLLAGPAEVEQLLSEYGVEVLGPPLMPDTGKDCGERQPDSGHAVGAA